MSIEFVTAQRFQEMFLKCFQCFVEFWPEFRIVSIEEKLGVFLSKLCSVLCGIFAFVQAGGLNLLDLI